jgi:hypothetical protein
MTGQIPQSGAAPPGNEQAPSMATRGSSKYSADQTSINAVTDVPVHRPWSRRRDGREVERRFRVDQSCWRRRVDAARRLSYAASDEVAPRGGWNALETTGDER